MPNTKPDKRQIILDITLTLVAERGLHNTPMSLISKESKISMGTIYHYFESKEVLINALYLELKQSMTSFYQYDSSGSYEEKLTTLWLNAYHYFNKNPHVISFMEQCANSPIIKEETKAAISQSRELSTNLLQEGIDLGILKPLRIFLIQKLIYASIVTAVENQIENKEVEVLAKICIDGLKL